MAVPEQPAVPDFFEENPLLISGNSDAFFW
jgi:hypothetical protein